MEVTIGFARADFERLLHELSPESPSYTILRRCPELDRWASEKPFSMCVVVVCNQEEARQLLAAVKQHYPQAVADIEYGFKSRGV